MWKIRKGDELMIHKSERGREIKIGPNKKLILKLREFLLLKEIFIHGVMQSRSVHDFIQTLAETPIHSNTISNRLQRLVDTDILSIHKEKLTSKWSSEFRHHYMLGSVGVAILEEEGELTSEEAADVLSSIEQIKIPAVEHVAASIIANEVYLECYYNQDVFDLSHQKADKHEWVTGTKWFQLDWINQPHWVFETDALFICLVINPKIGQVGGKSYRGDGIALRYEEVEQFAQSKEKMFLLVFSILDSSLQLIPEEKLPNVVKRVRDTKLALLSDTKIKGEMEILVLPTSRTATIVSRILTHELTFKTSNDFHELQYFDLEDHIAQLGRGDISVERYVSPVSPKNKNDNDMYTVTQKGRSQHIIVIHGVEGAMYTFYRLVGGIQRISRNRLSKYTSIWVIYDSPDQPEHDVLISILGIEFWLSDTRTWHEEIHTNKQIPAMLKVNRINRKNRLKYFM